MRARLARLQPRSLRVQLALVAMGMVVMAWLAGGLVVGRVAQQETAQLHDRGLRQMAGLLLALAGPELEELGPDASLADRIANARADSDAAIGGAYRYQIWSDDGRLLLANFGSPHAAAMARFGPSGFSDVDMDEARWRVYTLHDADAARLVQVAERQATVGWAPGSLDLPLLGLVLLSVVAVLAPTLWLLQRLLRPLGDLAVLLGLRSPLNLEPVALARSPAELAPVLASLNALFARVQDAVAHERGFTALAAHELRTPLATLRALAEALVGCEEPVRREALVADLLTSVDRCAHLQEQLLTLSRLDGVLPAQFDERFDLAEVLVDVQSELGPRARARGQRLAFWIEPVTLRGHAFGVRTLLRNLVSNAVRYTPDGGRIEVRTVVEGTDLRLVVDDSGPGIPAADRSRVFERFVRLQRHQASGVGLGLSIVRAVAEAHGAEIVLAESPLGGLSVGVCFPGRAEAAPDLPAGDDEAVCERLPLSGGSSTSPGGRPARKRDSGAAGAHGSARASAVRRRCVRESRGACRAGR